MAPHADDWETETQEGWLSRHHCGAAIRVTESVLVICCREDLEHGESESFLMLCDDNDSIRVPAAALPQLVAALTGPAVKSELL